MEITHYSEGRSYATSEDTYDSMYGRELNAGLLNTQIAATRSLLAKALDVTGKTKFNNALELGAGTDRLTLPLYFSNLIESLTVTDISEAFLHLVDSKIQKFSHSTQQDKFTRTSISYGILDGEDLEKTARKDTDLIILGAVLHHFLNYKDVIRKIGSSNPPGLALIMMEPCIDFSMTFAPLISAFCRANKDNLSGEDLLSSRMFVNALKFRTQDDYKNKHMMEDKHIFRSDEIIELLSNDGFCVQALPNGRERKYDPSKRESNESDFVRNLRTRLGAGNGFSNSFCDEFCRFYEEENEILCFTHANVAGPFFDYTYIPHKKG